MPLPSPAFCRQRPVSFIPYQKLLEAFPRKRHAKKLFRHVGIGCRVPSVFCQVKVERAGAARIEDLTISPYDKSPHGPGTPTHRHFVVEGVDKGPQAGCCILLKSQGLLFPFLNRLGIRQGGMMIFFTIPHLNLHKSALRMRLADVDQRKIDATLKPLHDLFDVLQIHIQIGAGGTAEERTMGLSWMT